MLQLNVHSSKLNFFEENTGELQEITGQRYYDWITVLGTNFRY